MEPGISNNVNARNFVSEGRWPLSFALKLPRPYPPDEARGKPTWFSYDLYRGHRNRKPELLYAKTREESESIAYYKFLEEPHRVLGFDLEWPCYIAEDQNPHTPLQNRVGLITIASEDKVALFHIGAHDGHTPEELVAPSLRKIIECADFVKVGVNILSADFRRLQAWFGLKPQGAVELSHLHRLVSAGNELGSCTTKLCSLEKQVKLHLGLPLDKGNSRVRTSNWSRKVLSKEQRLYAANDAYSGLMLYHYLEARRLAMDPVPPPLLWHERYEWFEHIPGRGTQLLLQLGDEDENDGSVRVIPVSDWFAERHENVYSVDPEHVARRPPSVDPVDAQENATPNGAAHRRNLPATPSGWRRRVAVAAASPQSQRGIVRRRSRSANPLLKKLKDQREKFARQRRWELYQVAPNSVLEEIARKKPRSVPELLAIKGMGKKRSDKFGKAFLNIVILHERQEAANHRVEEGEQPEATDSDDALHESSDESQNHSSRQNPTGAEPSTPPPRRPLQIHTGLTSMVQRTNLLQEPGSRDQPIGIDESDEDLPMAQDTPRGAGPSSATPSRRLQRPVRTTPQLHGLYRWFLPRGPSGNT